MLRKTDLNGLLLLVMIGPDLFHMILYRIARRLGLAESNLTSLFIGVDIRSGMIDRFAGVMLGV